MALIVRALQESDAADLAGNCFPELPPDELSERVREALSQQESGEGFTIIAEEDGRVGMHVKLVRSGEDGWLFDVASHPDFRGRGIFQKVFNEVVTRAREMGLRRLLAHVRADNTRARKAYEKCGFKCVGQDGMRGEQLRYELSIQSAEKRAHPPQ